MSIFGVEGPAHSRLKVTTSYLTEYVKLKLLELIGARYRNISNYNAIEFGFTQSQSIQIQLLIYDLQYTFATNCSMIPEWNRPYMIGASSHVLRCQIHMFRAAVPAQASQPLALMGPADQMPALPQLYARFDLEGDIGTFDEAQFIRRLARLIGVSDTQISAMLSAAACMLAECK